MPSATEHSSEYVSPASQRRALVREEGTLELPLAIPERSFDDSAHQKIRVVSPERSPLWALGVGSGFACALIVSFWMWMAFFA